MKQVYEILVPAFDTEADDVSVLVACNDLRDLGVHAGGAEHMPELNPNDSRVRWQLPEQAGGFMAATLPQSHY